jgi:hypothetical protein
VLEIKKAVKIPEALHGFDFNLKDQRRKILPVRFHHHQLLSDNILIICAINTFHFLVRAFIAIWETPVNNFFRNKIMH